MKIFPSLDEVLELRKDGQYKVAPVCCELMSDICTPIQAVRKLKNVSSHCFLLESAEEQETWGRYTFLGFDPKMSITCLDGIMQAGDIRLETDDPSSVLRRILSEYRSPRLPGLPPFTGGLVGYFAYDYIGYAEPTAKRVTEDTERFQDVDLMLFDKVIAFDNFRQKIVLIVNTRLSEGEAGYHRAEMELQALRTLLTEGAEAPDQAGRLTGDVTPLFSREAFCDMVEKAKHYIREG
ncbi:MAG: anthranilate synthase component I, partial [Clostridia bacterium]|nr:anthranilate synthase component I [Clostridia bacterium]